MTKTDYDNLKVYEPFMKRRVSSADLKNKNDRTLLYGANFVNRQKNYFHIYIENEVIYKIIYDEDGTIIMQSDESNIFNNESYIPAIVVPSCSDLEFCQLLIDKNIEIPFIYYSEKKPDLIDSKYFGKKIEKYTKGVENE